MGKPIPACPGWVFLRGDTRNMFPDEYSHRVGSICGKGLHMLFICYIFVI